MRVLVATDLSDAADTAIREGAKLASTPADAFGIVHVPLPPRLIEDYFPARAEDRTAMLARAFAALQERAHRACERQAELFVEDGVDYVEIVNRAEQWKADVIVVASHGRSGIARVLGRVAEAVVRNAHCNVLVVRSGVGHGWVLAATDLSDPSFPAIVAAAAEARRRAARLEVVHAVGFLDMQAAYLVELGTPSISPPPNVFEAAARHLSECVARLHVDATCKVLDRPAAAAIVGEADAVGAELVVVGSRGRSGLQRLVLGSVAEKVTRAAGCSVLVVRLGELRV
jgi:nucleotide-binding universal stress UspA family protein